MSKLSWMKWYPDAWMRDTRPLSTEAKGCWIEILMLMWNAPKRGRWTGTYQEFARVTGQDWESAPRIVQELGKVSRVTIRDNEVTLECRRMLREDSHYKDHAIRQKEYRERHSRDKKVTDKTLQDSPRLSKTLQENTLTKRVFVKPSAEDVTAYGASIGFRVDGSAFCDFYESKGWKIGSSPMRSWQAAVRTWKRRPRDMNETPAAPVLPPPPSYQDIPEEDRMTPEEMREIRAKAMGGLNDRAKEIV